MNNKVNIFVTSKIITYSYNNVQINLHIVHLLEKRNNSHFRDSDAELFVML